jgi:hypothetical protein
MGKCTRWTSFRLGCLGSVVGRLNARQDVQKLSAGYRAAVTLNARHAYFLHPGANGGAPFLQSGSWMSGEEGRRRPRDQSGAASLENVEDLVRVVARDVAVVVEGMKGQKEIACLSDLSLATIKPIRKPRCLEAA